MESIGSHYGELRRWSRMLARDDSEADELVQEAIMSALRNPQLLALDEAAQLRWLRRAMKSRLIDIRRRERLSRERELVREEPFGSDDLTHVEVAQALGMLTPDQQQVVAMRVMAGMNSTQIAEALGIPAATVRTRLRVAMQRLRQLRQQDMI